MSQTGKKPTKKGATAKGAKGGKGLITSLHVAYPAQLKVVQEAAALRGESVSKFLLSVGAKEATRVLGGTCPTCGRSLKAHKSHAQKRAA